MSVRIIPRLDIKGPNLVKGIHLEGLRVLGRPADFAKLYYEAGADELLYMDVVASLYERNSLENIIEQTAKEIFIPLTVGGGLRTVEDIKRVLRAGADKVLINTAAIKNPHIIEEAAMRFGSSTIAIAIEAIKQSDGRYYAFIDNGREFTGIEVQEWAQKIESLGAGEVVITSVDNEGTGKGYDLALVKSISSLIKIPIIAHGGAGKKEHVLEVLKKGDIDAVSMASLFHYEAIKSNKTEIHTDGEGNFDFLRSGKSVQNIDTTSIGVLKDYLLSNNIMVRK